MGVSGGMLESPRGARIEGRDWGLENWRIVESDLAWMVESFGLEDKAEARDAISDSRSAWETESRRRVD